MTGTLAGRAPRTDPEWVRDITQRVRRLENPKSVRVGPWVLQNNPVTGSLIASRPGESVDLGGTEPVEIDIWALAQRAKTSGEAAPVTPTEPGGGLDIGEIAESIFADLYEQLTGLGIDPVGALSKLGDFLKMELGGPIDITRLPLLPLAHIRDIVTELLDDPFFDNAATLLNFTDWLWDDSDGVQTPGVAKTTADGLTHTIFSNPIPVRLGDTLNLLSKVKTEGPIGGGSPLQMLVSFYDAANAMIGAPVLLDSTGATGGSWQTMTAEDVDVPAGATYAVQELNVTPAANGGGAVKFGQASVSKVGLLPTSYVNGLVDALAGLWNGLAARLQDFQDLLDVFFDAPVGSGLGQLTDVANRIKWLSPLTGIFDASKIGNMAALPSIPDGLNKVGDLGALVDKATAALSGATQAGQTIVGAALEDAEKTMSDLFDMLVANTRKVQALEAEQTANSVGGRRFNVNFSDYPNGPFPAGLFDVTYSGPGTSTLSISDGKAGWTFGPGGYRRATLLYPTPTLTDFQVVRGTMSSPPQQGTNVRIWSLGRMNAAKTDCVFARGYCTGFLSYKGDIGCIKGGVEYVWASNISLTWSLDLRVIMGVGVNVRRHMVLSGDTVVWDGIEPVDKQSLIGDGHRYWGSISETDGSKGPGNIAGASAVDNAPPAVVGTTFRASKRTGGDMSIGTGGVRVPNNFYETVDYISPDLVYTPGSNCRITVSKQGTYIIAWRALHGQYASGSFGHGLLFRNGVPYERWHWGGNQLNLGFSVNTTQEDATTGFAMVPLSPGDWIEPGFAFTSNMANTGDNVALADGSQSWFSVTRVGI